MYVVEHGLVQGTYDFPVGCYQGTGCKVEKNMGQVNHTTCGRCKGIARSPLLGVY